MGKRKKGDAFADLLASVYPETLKGLVEEMAISKPDLRAECLKYLRKHATLSEEQKVKADSEAFLSLWGNISPDMEDLEDYGGEDYRTQDRVESALADMKKLLSGKRVGLSERREVLDEVLNYIEGGNTGMDDSLYDLAYACCYGSEDLLYLAGSLEAMDGWPKDHAMRIYRKLGDHESYCRLRLAELVHGNDYCDLADYYWKRGEKEKAIKTAEEGLEKAGGSLTSLREFLAIRAAEGGDRTRALRLRLDEALDGLSLSGYRSFREFCTEEEWPTCEPEILEALEETDATEAMNIHMERLEFSRALAILVEGGCPTEPSWWDLDLFDIAERLEECFPTEIRDYYVSGMALFKTSAPRKQYEWRAGLLKRIRHVMVDLLDDEKAWFVLARRVKRENARRPAFQQEVASVLPGWSEL